jgi:hypothetical protein
MGMDDFALVGGQSSNSSWSIFLSILEQRFVHDVRNQKS